MLKIKLIKNNENIEKIIFNGHAKFDSYGKDIVCAAASSMLITTVNAILEFDDKSIIYKMGKYIEVENVKKDLITNKLLKNLYELLKELESQYSKNIKIEEEKA